jgi:hypothetical protein
MSIQMNQYLIYGARLDCKKYNDFEMFERFCDSAFNKEMNPNGLHCIFDGMDGKYIYIGHCLKKSLNNENLESFVLVDVSEETKKLTKISVKRELGIEAEMNLHFITHIR